MGQRPVSLNLLLSNLVKKLRIGKIFVIILRSEGTDPEAVTALSDAGTLRRTADRQRSQSELSKFLF